MRPPLNGVLETALYVADPQRSVEFYERVFGFVCIAAYDRLCAMATDDRRILLLFRKGATEDTDGDGQLHLAFAIAAEALPPWEAWLAHHGIAIEKREHWPLGGESIYFRDPDRHLLELATPGVWSVY
jgi:catechol 2,3-dioxygenase-like lactoylglutathione lyase family enzyme